MHLGTLLRVLDPAVPEASYQRFSSYLSYKVHLSVFFFLKPNKPLQALSVKEKVPTNSLSKQGLCE